MSAVPWREEVRGNSCFWVAQGLSLMSVYLTALGPHSSAPVWSQSYQSAPCSLLWHRHMSANNKVTGQWWRVSQDFLSLIVFDSVLFPVSLSVMQLPFIFPEKSFGARRLCFHNFGDITEFSLVFLWSISFVLDDFYKLTHMIIVTEQYRHVKWIWMESLDILFLNELYLR